MSKEKTVKNQAIEEKENKAKIQPITFDEFKEKCNYYHKFTFTEKQMILKQASENCVETINDSWYINYLNLELILNISILSLTTPFTFDDVNTYQHFEEIGAIQHLNEIYESVYTDLKQVVEKTLQSQVQALNSMKSNMQDMLNDFINNVPDVDRLKDTMGEAEKAFKDTNPAIIDMLVGALTDKNKSKETFSKDEIINLLKERANKNNKVN